MANSCKWSACSHTDCVRTNGRLQYHTRLCSPALRCGVLWARHSCWRDSGQYWPVRETWESSWRKNWPIRSASSQREVFFTLPWVNESNCCALVWCWLNLSLLLTEGVISQLQHRVERMLRERGELEEEHKAALLELQEKNERWGGLNVKLGFPVI